MAMLHKDVLRAFVLFCSPKKAEPQTTTQLIQMLRKRMSPTRQESFPQESIHESKAQLCDQNVKR